MKILKILEKIGLTETESSAYLTLLKQGAQTIAGLSEKSGIYRPALYKALPILLEKNIVSKTKKGKRTYFVAEHPHSLLASVDSLKSELEKELPGLEEDFARNKHKPAIRFFEGRAGISHTYEELVADAKRGDIIYRYESPKDHSKIKTYYPQMYWDKASERGGLIEKYVITNEKTQKSRKQRLNRYSKMIPASFDPFEHDMSQLILRDKVAFIDYASETASIIESQAFADFQRKIFKLLFRFL